jgi:hypothetical protein
MALAFDHFLWRSLATLHLNNQVVHELQSNVARLGSLDAPPGVDEQTTGAIRSAVAAAFVLGFRLIVLLCAVLAAASAVVAWLNFPSSQSAAGVRHFRGAAAAD